jgi:Aldo/keto reductase family
VNHLDQVTIAHQPGHETAKADLVVKYRREVQVTTSLNTAVFPHYREICVPPFRQARRPASSLRADMMSTFALGPMQVRRSGYGAMQLAGPYAFGTPPDRASAIGVFQAAVAAGVDHIDTAQYYGPGVVNDLIREALSVETRP